MKTPQRISTASILVHVIRRLEWISSEEEDSPSSFQVDSFSEDAIKDISIVSVLCLFFCNLLCR